MSKMIIRRKRVERFSDGGEIVTETVTEMEGARCTICYSDGTKAEAVDVSAHEALMPNEWVVELLPEFAKNVFERVFKDKQRIESLLLSDPNGEALLHLVNVGITMLFSAEGGFSLSGFEVPERTSGKLKNSLGGTHGYRVKS